MNGLNKTYDNIEDIDDDNQEEQLNTPQVVNELTDVPFLSTYK